MLLNCGAGEDSWESLGLQGDPTSQPFFSLVKFHVVDDSEHKSLLSVFGPESLAKLTFEVKLLSRVRLFATA